MKLRRALTSACCELKRDSWVDIIQEWSLKAWCVIHSISFEGLVSWKRSESSKVTKDQSWVKLEEGRVLRLGWSGCVRFGWLVSRKKEKENTPFVPKMSETGSQCYKPLSDVWGKLRLETTHRKPEMPKWSLLRDTSVLGVKFRPLLPTCQDRAVTTTPLSWVSVNQSWTAVWLWSLHKSLLGCESSTMKSIWRKKMPREQLVPLWSPIRQTQQIHFLALSGGFLRHRHLLVL